jgi:hypothetical protein
VPIAAAIVARRRSRRRPPRSPVLPRNQIAPSPRRRASAIKQSVAPELVHLDQLKASASASTARRGGCRNRGATPPPTAPVTCRAAPRPPRIPSTASSPTSMRCRVLPAELHSSRSLSRRPTKRDFQSSGIFSNVDRRITRCCVRTQSAIAPWATHWQRWRGRPPRSRPRGSRRPRR